MCQDETGDTVLVPTQSWGIASRGHVGSGVVHRKKKQSLPFCRPEPLLPSGGSELDPHEGHQPRCGLLLGAPLGVTGDGLPGPEGAAVS